MEHILFFFLFLFLQFFIYKAGLIANSSLEFKGITFVGDRYCPEVSFDTTLARKSLSNLRNTGANWVSIVVTEYQDYVNSTEIYPIYKNYPKSKYYTYKTETMEALESIIHYAHYLNLKVMLKPHIDLSKEPQYDVIWRGDIGREFNTTEQWDSWFSSYQKFIVKYAKLAEETSTEMLSVSCELNYTNLQDARWRKVIKQVRSVYSGLLIDSANHDGEEYAKTWWDTVDYIGVDAYYFPIQTTNLTLNESYFEKEIQPTLDKLEMLSQKWKKNIIISEIGFCSGDCYIGKRDYIPNPVDMYIQGYFYETFLKVFSQQSYIKGFFWWAWNSDPNTGGSEDGCITPQYKAAEYVLMLYYNGKRSELKLKPEGKPLCKCTI